MKIENRLNKKIGKLFHSVHYLFIYRSTYLSIYVKISSYLAKKENELVQKKNWCKKKKKTQLDSHWILRVLSCFPIERLLTFSCLWFLKIVDNTNQMLTFDIPVNQRFLGQDVPAVYTGRYFVWVDKQWQIMWIITRILWGNEIIYT